MTTDASRSNADQWHIPPAGDDQPNMFNTGKLPRDPGCDHFALLPKQPTVIATHVVDLTPVVAFFREELQRLRDQLAVERTAASSARESLAACEERLRASEMARALANSDAVEARKELRAQLEQAKTVPPGLVPGSVEAVLEAYRLLAGRHPHWDEQEQWVDDVPGPGDVRIYKALGNIISWLDRNAPGGRP